MPNDLWAANFNCPGQVVISGTPKGIETAAIAMKAAGAKRVLPLNVHGAFHSGLMHSAERSLAPEVNSTDFNDSEIALAMNVSGGYVKELDQIRSELIAQVTSPVRWENSIRAMAADGVTLFVEIGAGKTLAGMNKRIGVTAPTISLNSLADLDRLHEMLQTAVLL
jgi:[acyl-carrier-protein] S-malonyltransferase